jgi:hypothetical protein
MLASGVMSFDPSLSPQPKPVTPDAVDAAFPELPRLMATPSGLAAMRPGRPPR